jgi:hypothetical protein
MDRDSRELANRVCGILLPGARESVGFVSVFDRTAQNRSGSHHPDRFFDFLSDVSTGRVQVELCHRLRIPCGRCVLHVQEVAFYSSMVSLGRERPLPSLTNDD